MPTDLIEFWRRCDLTRAPFAHPDDWAVLRRHEGRHIHAEPRDFPAFISGPDFGDFKDTRFHLSLLPLPYGGDLRTADIVVLLLNPGFAITDYYAENRPEFRHRVQRLLAQDFSGVDFPFIWLDPEYCWHGGFLWWERKLRAIALVIARERFRGRYLDALHDLSRRLAHVELVPYHSRSFGAHRLVDDLPSANAARSYAQSALVEGARNGGKTIIITRTKAAWRIPAGTPNLVVYEGGLTRGAGLGPTTIGGQAILARYCIYPPSSGEPLRTDVTAKHTKSIP